MPTAEVNGTHLYYEVKGGGEPLVVINGLGADISEFGIISKAFADDFEVLVFDNRGAGRSDKPDEPYSVEQMANDTVGVMQAAGIEKANIMGISMGGRIALELALSHPAIVNKLVLVSTSARVVRQKSIGNFLAFNVMPHIPILKGKYPQPYFAFKRQREASSSYDCSARLNEIDKPTLIAHGKGDKTAPLLLANELHEGITHSTLKTFKGGHLFFMLRERQRFIETVKDFLGG